MSPLPSARYRPDPDRTNPDRPAPNRTDRRGRCGAAALALTMAAAAAVAAVATSGPARADTRPPTPSAATPVTVSADPLPTVQVDGVVWAQVTLGNTVYATGEFTTARPAGAAAGTHTTARANLLAYDIRTGALITSFNHRLDGAGRALAVSPDGRRLYVGGTFTRVDRATRHRIAAFDTATGALVSGFAPDLNNRVSALTVSRTTVYAGGSFTAVNGHSRLRLAAFSTGTGALLSWAPKAHNNGVNALVMSPDGSRVIAGGNFPTIGSTTVNGSASLDAATGALRPWAANAKVRNSGANAGILSLHTDGHLIYATAYTYVGSGHPGSGNLEGSFAADPDTGRIAWLEDCHGDSYDSVALGGVLYVAGHPYYCGNVGGFPDTYPHRVNRYAVAFSTAATGVVAANTHDTFKTNNWGGLPAPTLQTWFPTFRAGTYTGQSQAAWSTTGNSRYIAYGGEFPSVNGIAQQGLVRFALPGSAPGRVGPRPGADGLVPTASSPSRGVVKLSWLTGSDRDNIRLTYAVIRDSAATPAHTVSDSTPDWVSRTLTVTDTGLTPGTTHTYRIRMTDPDGNAVSNHSVSVTVRS